MHRLRYINIGYCSWGPIFDSSNAENNKHVICIANFDRNKHLTLLTCKITSKSHDKVFPGEFLVKDLFNKGPSKIQPYNVFRLDRDKINLHRWVGKLDSGQMPRFELGLKLGIKKGMFTPSEILEIADSWEPFFSI